MTPDGYQHYRQTRVFLRWYWTNDPEYAGKILELNKATKAWPGLER